MGLKAKLAVLILLGAAGAVVAGSVGVWVAHDGKRAVQAINTDTMVPLQGLQQVGEFIREVELRIPGVMTGMFSGPGSKSYIETVLPEMRRLWSEIERRPVDAGTAELQQEFDRAFRQFHEGLLPKLIPALAKEDRKALEALGDEWVSLKKTLLKPHTGLMTAWQAEVVRAAARAEDQQRKATWGIVGAVALCLGLMVPLGLRLVRGIVVPMGEAVTLLKQLAQGQGDLTVRLPARGRDEVGLLAESFNLFMDKLAGIIGHVRLTVTHVTGASQQLSGATVQLAAGAQQQAASLEETGAALEQITATVKQNADNARQATQLAGSSRDAAERGGQVVSSAVASMQEITRASKKIADIIGVIDEIAFQTNLLALNAAVEAARAGEQGRGFAVVAAEVRNLAQRSAGAAKEIKTLIQDSVAKVEEGSDLVNKSGQTLDDIVQSAKRVAGIVADIAGACQEQSSGIDEVNRAVAEMDRVTQDNAARTEELSSTSQALAQQAEDMLALVGRFTLPDAERGDPSAATPSASHAADRPRRGRGPERGRRLLAGAEFEEL